MKPDKYLFLDIGSAETKILEAEIINGKIVLLKTAVMQDMSLYQSDSHVIQGVEGFCLSLKKTLKDADIKTRKAIVCSSILGLQTKDISEEFKNYKDCSNRFSRTYGRAVDPTSACDWQFMGEYITDRNISHKLVMTTGYINIVENFLLAMHKIAGITVVNLESSFTAQANLQAMYSASFDLPSIAIISAGSQSIQCQYFKGGAFVLQTSFKSNIMNLSDIIAKQFNIPQPKAWYLLHKGGMREKECDKLLPAEGIDTEAFISVVQAQVNTLLQEIQQNILSATTSKHLENVRAIFTGGIFNIPGVAEYISKHYNFTPHDFLNVTTTFESRDFTIVNKLGRTLSPKFANCLGLTLKIFNNIHTINIVPKELVLVDFGKAASGFTFGYIFIAVFAAMAIFAAALGQLRFIIDHNSALEELETVESAYEKTAAEVEELKGYLSNLTSINKSLTPFIQDLSSYETPNLRIASVDTKNILKVTVTSPNSEQVPEVEENPLADLVVRGYAKTSADITAFYNKLHSNKSIGSLNMNGIREVSLNRRDTIYIFELELEVVGNA